MREYESSLTIKFILAAVVLGTLTGCLLGPKAGVVGIVGTLFIQLIKAFAVPLVLLSIIDAVLSTQIRVKQAGHLVVVLTINSICAATIGLLLSNIFLPGAHLKDAISNSAPAVKLENFVPKALSFTDVLKSWVPPNLVQPFLDSNVIAVVFVALLLGFGIRESTRVIVSDREIAQKVVSIALRAWTNILRYLTALVPIAVFAVTARTVGEHGFQPFIGLSWYVVVGIMGLFLHVIVVYPLWIVFIARLPLKSFYREAKAPMTFAFGTNSSLATLPITLNALDQLKVDKSSSRLGACVATNFNNDGILLYEAMAVLFVAQAYGIDLTLTQQLLAVGLAAIAAIGVAGVPEAGVVSLSLVLATVGLPLEILPLLLTVDWIIARCRSVVNVLADMTVSSALHGLSR